MKMINLSYPFLFLYIALTTVLSCTDKKPDNWMTSLDMLGTYSSPRTADLNNDGVLDIVMGAGGQEEQYSDTAVVALDGATGKLLWAAPGANQFVGSAVFRDISNDGIPDVFIGGRWAELAAINGADGKLLWKFFPERTQPNPADSGWFNFTTPQFIPDQDDDKIEDLIIANGGNPQAAPFDPNRPAGRLLVLSSKTGRILSNVQVPDGKETYLSVICLDPNKSGNPDILFGTGGETIGGNLYRTSLKDIMRGDISNARILASSDTKGFIASPLYADVNRDGVYDIIATAVDGRIIAINGKNDNVIWQVSFPGTEAYATPALGYFNGDAFPDVFCNFAIGTFPSLTKSIRFMVDGQTGKISFQDTVPAFQYASPVTADFNGDGHDDILINESVMQKKQFEVAYYCHLLIIDFINNRKYAIGDTLQGTNLAATPWIGDLDKDNKMDVIYSTVKYNDVVFDLQKPLRLTISRYNTGIAIKKPIHWGAYLGSRYTGVFPID